LVETARRWLLEEEGPTGKDGSSRRSTKGRIGQLEGYRKKLFDPGLITDGWITVMNTERKVKSLMQSLSEVN